MLPSEELLDSSEETEEESTIERTKKCGDDVFLEPIKKKKLRKKGKPKKERTEIVYNDGTCYRIRHTKDGVKWHSYVDPQRPDSPVVEFPEYPGDELKDGYTTLNASEDTDEVKREAEKVYQDYLNEKAEKGRKKMKTRPDPAQDMKDFMGPEEIISDAGDGVFMEKIPGLYPGDGGTFSPAGGIGGHEYDEY